METKWVNMGFTLNAYFLFIGFINDHINFTLPPCHMSPKIILTLAP